MSAQSAVVTEMRNFARARMEAAQNLMTIAESLEEMDGEKFTAILGAEYGGSGWVSQMLEQVEAAAMARPGQQWGVNKALAEALGTAQRQVTKSEQEV